MGLSFFGLTPDSAPKIRKNLFTQIHEIVFHGKGGYDWHTVYNMPIWLRNYTFSLINEHYEKEKKAYEDANKTKKGNSKTLIGSDGKISSKNIAKNFSKSFSKSNYK